ncbi:keratin-associated protein 27-1 [Manis pentadactyla]|uniref:keratin-associated protein 27-1 n=1 Tax=Manis pentadactyla TaxID=143292 RepID=UPI00255CF3E9|nr:keratin-associated protein 27-1 [Manis pentadactyla]
MMNFNQGFNSMSQSHCHSLSNVYSVAPLSAIVHASNLRSFEDGLFLPSSCHGRTWFLDNFQESCSETTSFRVPSCEQELCTKESCVQSACLPRVVQTTCFNSKPYERTACQSGRSSAVLEHVSQPCPSGSRQQMGFIDQSCQLEGYVAKSCPPKTFVSQSCQILEYESSQCQLQSPEPRVCRPLVYVPPRPQLLESSYTYEPTCCVTGGLYLPSK